MKLQVFVGLEGKPLRPIGGAAIVPRPYLCLDLMDVGYEHSEIQLDMKISEQESQTWRHALH
jgi:hypothetical protein